MSIRNNLILLAIIFSISSASFAQYQPAGCLNADEELLGELVNQYRIDHGLSEVPLSHNLSLVGQWHVEDHNYAAEVTGELGSDPNCNSHTWYGIPGAPYSTCCYTSDHAQAACMWNKPEEISDGVYMRSGFELAAWGYSSVSAALVGWSNSPGHNDVMLNQDIWSSYTWRAMGVGADTGSRRYFLWFSTLTDPDGVAVPCGVVPAGGQVPTALSVRAVYPNPFNPRVAIAFDLGHESQVGMTILDVRGIRVRTMGEISMAAGNHELIWNGLNDAGDAVPSGVYFVRLRAGKDVQTTKVALLR